MDAGQSSSSQPAATTWQQHGIQDPPQLDNEVAQQLAFICVEWISIRLQELQCLALVSSMGLAGSAADRRCAGTVGKAGGQAVDAQKPLLTFADHWWPHARRWQFVQSAQGTESSAGNE